MGTVRWIISTAPEIFLLLAIAIGTVLGRVKIRGFSIGTTACILVVAVLIGQLGTFTFPSLLRVILFSLFVFTIGYRSGPEFFASLSIRTLAQVVMALVLGGTGLILVLIFAFTFKLDPGTASGLAAGGLTQSSIIGTASGALAQLGLPNDAFKQQEANIAAGYAVTYVLGYILTLLYVPFVAPEADGGRFEGGGGEAGGGAFRRQSATERKSPLSEIPSARLSGLDRRGTHGQIYRRGNRQPHCRRANSAGWSRR
ncbi:AspT/YidE/YbjL antiporter-like protein [Bradyrhizobium sp. i1.3.1]